MNFGGEYVLPKLQQLKDRIASVDNLRSRAAEYATGHVLDLSADALASSLYFFPDTITSLTVVTTSPKQNARLRQRARTMSFPIDIRTAPNALLPVKSAAFDCVVSTFALCTVLDIEVRLGEIRRVLKPGGRLLFVEYGLSREPKIARWQHRLAPIYSVFRWATRPLRYIDEVVGSSGLSLKRAECSYLARLPRALGCVYEGVAHNDI